MTIGRAARTEERRRRAGAEVGGVTPPKHVREDVSVLAEGRLAELIVGAHAALTGVRTMANRARVEQRR